MEFGQLVEYNMRTIFLEKSFSKCGEETIPRLFSKNSKLNQNLWINCLKFHIVFFLVYQVEGYQIILKLSCRSLPFPIRKILDNICIVIVFQPGCDVMKFEMNLIFLIKPLILYDQKVKTKI